MPEPDPTPDELIERLRHTPGLAPLVAEAVATWRARIGGGEEGAGTEGAREQGEPGWRAFSDAFPTFWEFTNRPR